MNSTVLEAALAKGWPPTPHEPDLRGALERIGVSSSRINAAVRDAGELGNAEVYKRAITHEKSAEQTFLQTALLPWCERHALTLKQAVSVLAKDSEFNPATLKDDLPSVNKIHAWLDQVHGFLARIEKEIDAGAPADVPPSMSPQRLGALLNGPYSDDPREAMQQLLAKLPPSPLADRVHAYLTSDNADRPAGTVESNTPRG